MLCGEGAGSIAGLDGGGSGGSFVPRDVLNGALLREILIIHSLRSGECVWWGECVVIAPASWSRTITLAMITRLFVGQNECRTTMILGVPNHVPNHINISPSNGLFSTALS